MKRSFSKLLASDWVITLTATLFGVFIALFLNEWVASRNLNNQISLATNNILTEIKSNQNSLERSIERNGAILETMRFLAAYLNEDEDSIAPVDSMNEFKSRYPNLIVIEDSTLLENGYCLYQGEIDINLSLSHIELTSIAWQTFKHSGISSSYDFNCLMYLESIDKIKDEVHEIDEELFEYIAGNKDKGHKNENLIRTLGLLIDYQESLANIYKTSGEELKDCM